MVSRPDSQLQALGWPRRVLSVEEEPHADLKNRVRSCESLVLTLLTQGLLSANVDADLRTGSLFADRYRVDQRLGSGAQKKTYQAWDTKADRPVALAVLSRTLSRR